MDILDLKKLALLGIAGGLLLTASDHNAIYAGEHEDSADPDKEAHGCDGKEGCEGKSSCDGKDGCPAHDSDDDGEDDEE